MVFGVGGSFCLDSGAVATVLAVPIDSVCVAHRLTHRPVGVKVVRDSEAMWVRALNIYINSHYTACQLKVH